jgi:Flp pilus assembly protein TadD/TolB-like protein
LKLHRFVICFLLSAVALAQTPRVGQTLLVVPFENRSKAPGIEWIGDAFPELLRQRLNSPTLYAVPREDRLRAYDRMGIPVGLRPSRATIYRMAEQLDVDYVVLGDYTFDGRTFTTTAELLDMRRERLSPKMTESGPLIDLIDVQTALAWDVQRSLFPDFNVTREAFLSEAPPVRLDAFENYIKGVIAPDPDTQIRYLKEALRASPAYSEALLQLGKAYYRAHEYEEAVSTLSKLPEEDSQAGEANFYLGLAAYSQGEFQRAETAFSFVAARLPLSEIYNNLGVAADHSDRKAAVEYLQKAVNADPTEADYHFNLGIELYRAGDPPNAARQLHETLSLRPDDAEARVLLNTVAISQGGPSASTKLPSQRLRTTYDENSFRQLAIKLDAAAEQHYAKVDPHVHAQFHVERGQELLNQGFGEEAEHDFREAVSLDPNNAEAHTALAATLEARGNEAEARSEAEQALQLRTSAAPLLILTRLDLRDNKNEAAAEHLQQALALEPGNADALALKRAVAAKLAQEGQPLPNR